MKKEVKYAIVGVSLAAFAGLAWYLINRKTCSSYTNEDDCRLNHCHWWNETCQSWNAQLPWTYPCLNFDSLDFCREGDGLRLDSVSMVGENEYDISRPYSFLMTDVQGKDLFFHYNTTSDLFANPWHETPYQMLYTYDGINWERIPDCEYNAGVYSFWITPTQNTIRISNFFAKDYAPIQYMMYSKQNSPYVRISNVSHSNDCPPSVPKMDIAMMEITNFSIPESQKVHAVCICRQHPYETYPSFTLEGCIDSILMDSKYRDYIHWYFIPCMNPRGVYYTIQRHNAPGTCGVDINRSWDKNPGEDGYAIETDLVKTKLIEINNRYGIDFFFDMHSQPGGGGGHSYVISTEVTPWCPIYSELTGYNCGTGVHDVSRARVWVHDVLDVPYSFTNEVAQKDWHITIPELHQNGWAIAESVYQVFYEPLEISLDELEKLHPLKNLVEY